MDTNTTNARIHDLGLAAAMVSSGFELKATNRDINGRFYFLFRQTKELTSAVNAYWADTLVVNARNYFDNTKMLKSRIYSEN